MITRVTKNDNSKYYKKLDYTLVKEEFLHFGYFSQINWKMVLELEKHCKEKNIISIEYILPHNEIKTITMHVDKISMSDSTEKYI